MKRFLLATLLGICLLLPTASQAQIDQRCWTKDRCLSKRTELDISDSLTQTQINEGFIQDDSTIAACGGKQWNKKDVGFCLPAGLSTTKISFGGETKFSNIGVFIKYMYRYTIWVAGILAAAMIVVAGFQWAASGGNSDSISSAKKRIAGAVAGLVLLSLSYTVLNTINPYLVNFRLPQVWLINGQGMAPFCSSLADDDGVELLGNVDEQKFSDAQKSEKFKTGTFALKPKQSECGKEYLFSSGGGQTCKGTACAAGNVCMRDVNAKSEACIPGLVGGRIYNTSLGGSAIATADSFIADVIAGAGSAVTGINFYEFPWVPETSIMGSDFIGLTATCSNGQTFKVDGSSHTLSVNQSELTEAYTINGVSEANLQSAIDKCGGANFFRGFAIFTILNSPNNIFNDEAHILGRTADGQAKDLGDLDTAITTFYNYDIASKIARDIDPMYYMTKEQILQGINLNINIADICAVYGEEQARKKCYGKFGYK